MGILKSSSGLPFQKPEGQSRGQPPWDCGPPFPGEHPTGHMEMWGVGGLRSLFQWHLLSVQSSRRPGEDYSLRACPSASGKKEVKEEVGKEGRECGGWGRVGRWEARGREGGRQGGEGWLLAPCSPEPILDAPCHTPPPTGCPGPRASGGQEVSLRGS